MDNPKTLIFLDTSVIIAAVLSPTGGSALILDICKGNKFKAAVSIKIILEARVNIAEKYGSSELVKFYKILAELEPEVVSISSENLPEKYKLIVALKDQHVIAAALQCRAKYLITLDKKHLLTPEIISSSINIKIVTPGDFIKNIVGKGSI